MAKTLLKVGSNRSEDYLGSLELKSLQQAVDGYIELLYFPNAIMIVDEEGLIKNKPSNVLATRLAGRHIVGDAIVLTNEDYAEFMKGE